MSGILIVDDHAVFRTAVRSLLEYHEFEVCAEASTGAQALLIAQQKQPEIIALDLEMPDMNGIEAAHELRRISPSAKIIVLTMHTADFARTHLQGLAHAFVTKVEAGRLLVPAIARLLRGEAALLAVIIPGNRASKNGALKYPWQHVVAGALDASPETRRARINLAERAIAARLASGDELVSEECIAIKEALKALRRLISELGADTQETAADTREQQEDIA